MDYQTNIIPKALWLSAIVPDDLINDLNVYLDEISKDRKYKNDHSAAADLAAVIKKGYQVYLDNNNPTVQRYTDFTHEMAKNYITEFSKWSQNNYSDKILSTESIWSVHQYAGDYNPVHSHNIPGDGPGFATVLWTKLPEQLEAISPDKFLYETKGLIKDFRLNGITDGHLCFLADPTTSIDENERFRFSGTNLVRPQAGVMCIFPLHLNHMVYPFEGPGERRTIASNISCKTI
tara:strand:- start:424 stop:1125 length:702 start_codon:yes stop_codon:yes gene_type:complete